jgi:hypothetical protein
MATAKIRDSAVRAARHFLPRCALTVGQRILSRQISATSATAAFLKATKTNKD